MTPVSPRTDVAYAASGHSVDCTDLPQRLPGFMECPDSYYIGLCQSGATMLFAPRGTIPAHHIGEVIGLSTGQDVTRITARTVVASVVALRLRPRTVRD